MTQMLLPSVPMAPITSPDIPTGSGWGYQIKWDGVRTIVRLDGNGGVEIFNRRLEPKDDRFPEIGQLLQKLRIGPCMLDGEICYFDGLRPNFSKVKGSVNKIKSDDSLIFVAFDLLYDDGKDIRMLPFEERYKRLAAAMPKNNSRVMVTDLMSDGVALWEWLNDRGWEGIISKRLDSPYLEGKRHKGLWLKKRKELRITANVVGIKLNEGRVSSLVLQYEGKYIGHVSGLDNAAKAVLEQFAREHPGGNPFAEPKKWHDVAWLAVPFPCRVTALEFSENGLLRQPKLLGFGAEK